MLFSRYLIIVNGLRTYQIIHGHRYEIPPLSRNMKIWNDCEDFGNNNCVKKFNKYYYRKKKET